VRWDSRGWFENESRGTNIATRASLGQIAGLLFSAVWLVTSGSVAQDTAPPGSGWSEPERWAWEEIRAGRIADFHTRDGRLDPRKPDGWGDKRKLSPDFLKEILFREPYLSALPIEGVRIVGAWFSEPVDLASGRLDRQLWLDGCRFEQAANLTFLQVNDLLSLEASAFAAQGDDLVSVDLTDAKLGGQLNLAGAHVAGKLGMGGLEVGDLFMPSATFQDVDLGGAKVGGPLNMNGVTVAGQLNMSGLEVGQDLFMTGPDATFRDVNLVGAKIGGQLDMHGATVEGKLNMNSLEVGQDLAMYSPAMFQDVDLGSAKIGGQLDMHGAIIAGKLNMFRLEVGEDLAMYGAAAFHDVDLVGARVGGQLAMYGATVTGKLNMYRLEVRRDLTMTGPNAAFKDVDLVGTKVGGGLSMADAKVDGRLAMNGATVTGKLDMNGLQVGRHVTLDGPDVAVYDVDLVGAKVGGPLNMDGAAVAGMLKMYRLEVGQDLTMAGPGTVFKNVDLADAKVGGHLAMHGATVAGTLNMYRLEVEQSLLMDQAILKSAALSSSHIGGALNLTGAEFQDLDLSATRIEGELVLSSAPRPGGPKGARLSLRDTHAGVLQIHWDKETDAWPDGLQLDGFTYDRLGFGSDADNSVARDVGRYIAWLARDLSYSPQPYEYLATVFRAAGESTKANRIRYESRERERADAWQQEDYARWFGLTLLKWGIGYGLGLRYFLALWWIVVFTLIGTIALHVARQGPEGVSAKAIFSLDLLLPIVQLDAAHNQLEASLAGRVKHYFYAHKLVGWVLASFLIAALAGLTQD
jgi:uncharacterized protein YjbI with pentapeptide repeats